MSTYDPGVGQFLTMGHKLKSCLRGPLDEGTCQTC